MLFAPSLFSWLKSNNAYFKINLFKFCIHLSIKFNHAENMFWTNVIVCEPAQFFEAGRRYRFTPPHARLSGIQPFLQPAKVA